MSTPARIHRTTLAIRFTAFALAGLAVGCSGAPDGSWEPIGSSQSATTVCGMTSVSGMDISHYDGTIDWATAKGSGIQFAFAKATESTNFTDPMFAANWAGMQAAGVARGAYHFFHADVDPVAQANFFLQAVGALQPGDLPPVLDLETTNGQSEATIAANAATFLSTVTAATGRTAIVYVSPAFLSDFSALSAYSLWVANWNVSCPDVPSAWSNWVFWQTSATGTVPGVSASQVDLDTFNGTPGQLQALGMGTVSGGDAGGGMDAGAGTDAGSGGTDSGPTGRDSGTLGSDAGAGRDSAGPPPPGGGDSGMILNNAPDGATPSDSGSAFQDTPTAPTASGCGCSVVGVPSAPPVGPAAGLLALLGACVRIRRRRSSLM